MKHDYSITQGKERILVREGSDADDKFFNITLHSKGIKFTEHNEEYKVSDKKYHELVRCIGKENLVLVKDERLNKIITDIPTYRIKERAYTIFCEGVNGNAILIVNRDSIGGHLFRPIEILREPAKSKGTYILRNGDAQTFVNDLKANWLKVALEAKYAGNTVYCVTDFNALDKQIKEMLKITETKNPTDELILALAKELLPSIHDSYEGLEKIVGTGINDTKLMIDFLKSIKKINRENRN